MYDLSATVCTPLQHIFGRLGLRADDTDSWADCTEHDVLVLVIPRFDSICSLSHELKPFLGQILKNFGSHQKFELLVVNLLHVKPIN